MMKCLVQTSQSGGGRVKREQCKTSSLSTLSRYRKVSHAVTVGIKGKKRGGGEMRTHLCLFFKLAGPNSVEDLFQGG